MKQPKGQFTKGLWEITKLISVLTFCFFILTLVGGCTTLTEAQKIELRHEREARILEHHDQWLEDKARCEANGGWIFVRWFGSPPLKCRHKKDCAPRPGDYYTCTKRIRVIP
jgi:hypothetical protein